MQWKELTKTNQIGQSWQFGLEVERQNAAQIDLHFSPKFLSRLWSGLNHATHRLQVVTYAQMIGYLHSKHEATKRALVIGKQLLNLGIRECGDSQGGDTAQQSLQAAAHNVSGTVQITVKVAVLPLPPLRHNGSFRHTGAVSLKMLTNTDPVESKQMPLYPIKHRNKEAKS
jgi:hypothetical protein